MMTDDEIRAFNDMAARIVSVEKAVNIHIARMEASIQALIEIMDLSINQRLDFINLSKKYEEDYRIKFGIPDEPE